MRKTLAITSAKLIKAGGKVFRKQGTALPGLLAEKIDPDLLSKLVKDNFPKGIIVVTGTNGKTTTSKMIGDCLAMSDISFIRNTAGSNLRRGIIATILAHSNTKGYCTADMAIFEVDEAYIPIVCNELQPKMIVVTNLFRDQLDRYGELDSIAKKFSETFKKLQTTLVLNADDPLVASLGRSASNPTLYFGISDYSGEKIENDHTADSVFTNVNGEKLHYLQRYFGHIGIYTSKNSDYSRPKPDFDLTKMRKMSSQSSKFDVKTSTETFSLDLSQPGLYNIYNCLAALTVLSSVGVNYDLISDSFTHTEAAFGRGEVLQYNKKSLQLLLIKNPTGFNQIIQTFLKQKPQTNPVLICINDNIADGRDVSWLWDSALEDIKSYSGKIIVSGTRAYDMALRLKYAGFDVSSLSIEPDLKKALILLTHSLKVSETGYVLPTYTAMLSLRELIASQGNHQVKDMSE